MGQKKKMGLHERKRCGCKNCRAQVDQKRCARNCRKEAYDRLQKVAYILYITLIMLEREGLCVCVCDRERNAYPHGHMQS